MIQISKTNNLPRAAHFLYTSDLCGDCNTTRTLPFIENENKRRRIYLSLFGLKKFLTNLTAAELTFILQSERVGRVIALKFQMFK